MPSKPRSRWKLVGLSLLSLAAVEITVSTAFACFSPPQAHWWIGIYSWLFVISLFAVPGWLIALPILLFTPNIEGRRVYILACIGTLIGPATIGAINLCVWLVDRNAGTDFGWGFVLIATVISALTTSIYLTFLKLSLRNRIQQPT